MINHKNTGFTLIELMVVIVIMAIMATIALPAMGIWIANQRLQNRADQIVTFFQFVRSEANRQNLPIVICPTVIRAGTAATNICNSFNGAQVTTQGLIAWPDTSVDNNFAQNKVIRAIAINQNDNDNNIIVSLQVLNSNNQNNAANTQRLGIMPNGMLGRYNGAINDPLQRWTMGQDSILITLTDANNANILRKVAISPSGRGFTCTATDITNKNNICSK